MGSDAFRPVSYTHLQDLQPYLIDFASYDVVSKYYSYAVQYYKNAEDEIQWLPICGIPQTIIANKTLFDQYGIKIPENYEEYVQACQQFYDNGIKPYSMDLGEDWSNNEIIQAAAIGEFTSPVSYTHLDVYKRQYIVYLLIVLILTNIATHIKAKRFAYNVIALEIADKKEEK